MMSQTSLPNTSSGLVWRNIIYDIPLANKDRQLKLKLSKDPEKTVHVKESKDSDEHRTRRILHDINGRVDRGELCGIMGASGSGKTTLLNVLSGRLSQTGDADGIVTYQGVKRQPTTWKRTIAFVEQDDALFARLTVRETIAYAAKLRLPNNEFDKEAKKKRVQETVEMLRLEGCENSRVGSGTDRGISGGERKRTSIGVELVSNASLLFLDEPTSGLDSYAAARLVSNLRDVIQQRNLACLMTIHQPSWAMFCALDRVTFLAKGSVYYDGPPRSTIPYFEGHGYKVPEGVNPADHFISIAENADQDEAGSTRVQSLIDTWRNHTSGTPSESGQSDDVLEGSRVAEKSKNVWPTPWSAELVVLLQRAAHDQMRDKGLWIGSIGQTLIYLIIIGFAFFRLGTNQADVLAKIGVLFIIPINAGFAAQAPVLASFALQRTILVRERSSALYRCSSFYLAKVLLQVPICVVTQLLYLIIVYFMIGLTPTASKLFIFVGIASLHVINSTCLGLAIAAVSPTVGIANIISPVISVIFLFFGGNFLPSPPPWFIWLKYISPLNYTYSALSQNEFAGQQLSCDGSGQAQCYASGDDVLRAYNLEVFNIGEDAGFLIALTVLFLVLGYIGLNISTRPRLRII